VNPEQQRIAIAEACGAKWYQWAGEYWITFKDWNARSHCYEADRPAETSNHPKIEVSVPDYLNDLNAMHEAEMFIRNAQDQMRYASETLIAMGFDDLVEASDLNVDYCWHVMGATAAQRAKAFLKTLNLWKQ
jgi:hypothetical protein